MWLLRQCLAATSIQAHGCQTPITHESLRRNTPTAQLCRRRPLCRPRHPAHLHRPGRLLLPAPAGARPRHAGERVIFRTPCPACCPGWLLWVRDLRMQVHGPASACSFDCWFPLTFSVGGSRSWMAYGSCQPATACSAALTSRCTTLPACALPLMWAKVLCSAAPHLFLHCRHQNLPALSAAACLAPFSCTPSLHASLKFQVKPPCRTWPGPLASS